MNTSTESSGLDTAAGGAEANIETIATSSKPEDKVSYDTYIKVLNEAKRAKAKLAEIESQEKAKTEADLIKNQEYKKLLDQRDSELNETKQKLTTYEQNYQNAQKLNAVLASLNGEVDEQYWGLIDLSKIAVDPDSGSPDKNSAAKYAKEFSSKFSLVVKKPTGAKVPADAANGTGKGLSYEEWSKLPPAEMKKRMAEVMMSDKKA